MKQSESHDYSPPGTTPSQVKDWKHGVEEDEIDEEIEDEIHICTEDERVLNTTEVFNAYENYDLVLQYIYSSFVRMSQVHMNHRPGVPQCLFKLYKNEEKITWHPITSTPIDIINLASSKFPRNSTKTLLALEDLGRGSTGKAWLACTLSKNPAICVLKFSNKIKLKGHLRQEKAWWDKIYSEFEKMTKIETWSGSKALVMPHFAPYLKKGEMNSAKQFIRC